MKDGGNKAFRSIALLVGGVGLILGLVGAGLLCR